MSKSFGTGFKTARLSCVATVAAVGFAAVWFGAVWLSAAGVAWAAEEPAKTPGRRATSGDNAVSPLPDLPIRQFPDSVAAAQSIRKLTGRHITLYTDLPAAPEVDDLPQVVDQAFPQWCDYFGIDRSKHGDWHIQGYVIKNKQRFTECNMLPKELPAFAHAYSQGREFWVYEKPGNYYTRHQVLHEATHCFSYSLLGDYGPPWYMEGTAELLATHHWDGRRLQLNYFPASSDEVPHWGRIKIVKDDFAARRAKTLRGVFDYAADAHRELQPYGWCWAAAAFLDGHPRYRDRFREISSFFRDPDLTKRFLDRLGRDAAFAAEEWQVFAEGLEYGYDFKRTVIDFTPGRPLPADGAQRTVAADRGWQNSGLRLEAGRSYRLQASGRYQVGKTSQVWWSEPNGVSIRYYKGRPLGVLLAAVRSDDVPKPRGPSPLINPRTIGTEAEFEPKYSGTLYLRINHSAAELSGNAGELTVGIREVRPVGEAPSSGGAVSPPASQTPNRP